LGLDTYDFYTQTDRQRHKQTYRERQTQVAINRHRQMDRQTKTQTVSR